MYRKTTIALSLALVAAACAQEQPAAVEKPRAAVRNISNKVSNLLEAQAPLGPRPSREEIERERFNFEWRKLQSFRAQAAAQQRAAAAAAQAAEVKVTFAPAGAKESFEGLDPAKIDSLPVRVPVTGDMSGPSVLRTQVLLDRANFSPGIMDGRWGKNSAIAVYWFQRQNGLNATGDVDEATYRALAQVGGSLDTVRRYTLDADEVKGPFTKIPDDVYEQEKLDCLCYESLSEKLGEQFHTSADFLRTINPGVDLDALRAGDSIWVLNVGDRLQTLSPGDIRKIIISVRGNYLNGVDAAGNIVFHAPTTLGSKYDPSPSETVQVADITFDPNFHYQPTLFHEVPDTNPEAHLKPGPNSPVGVVWIALTKPHYGIHGTSDPDSIGYASSHGCVRLTNWDARDLAKHISKGIDVAFVDTRGEK